METVRSGVIYVVGSFLAQMCPTKVASLASTWVCAYWRSVRSWAAQGQAGFCSYSDI